jgi:hypothetical protein
VTSPELQSALDGLHSPPLHVSEDIKEAGDGFDHMRCLLPALQPAHAVEIALQLLKIKTDVVTVHQTMMGLH